MILDKVVWVTNQAGQKLLWWIFLIFFNFLWLRVVCNHFLIKWLLVIEKLLYNTYDCLVICIRMPLALRWHCGSTATALRRHSSDTLMALRRHSGGIVCTMSWEYCHSATRMRCRLSAMRVSLECRWSTATVPLAFGCMTVKSLVIVANKIVTNKIVTNKIVTNKIVTNKIVTSYSTNKTFLLMISPRWGGSAQRRDSPCCCQ
jgi:hypothetical protein